MNRWRRYDPDALMHCTVLWCRAVTFGYGAHGLCPACGQPGEKVQPMTAPQPTEGAR